MRFAGFHQVGHIETSTNVVQIRVLGHIRVHVRVLVALDLLVALIGRIVRGMVIVHIHIHVEVSLIGIRVVHIESIPLAGILQLLDLEGLLDQDVLHVVGEQVDLETGLLVGD